MDIQKQIKDKHIDFQLAAKKIAPELGMGKGLRQGCGRQAKKGGQNNCPGQAGSGCARYTN
jgi:zinc resistance-associated protein